MPYVDPGVRSRSHEHALTASVSAIAGAVKTLTRPPAGNLPVSILRDALRSRSELIAETDEPEQAETLRAFKSLHKGFFYASAPSPRRWDLQQHP